MISAVVLPSDAMVPDMVRDPSAGVTVMSEMMAENGYKFIFVEDVAV